MKKKKSLNRYHLAEGLLVILVFLFSLSLYAHFHVKALKSTLVPSNEKQTEPKPAKESAVQGTWTVSLSEEFTSKDSILLFVNKSHPLSADYVPTDLTTPNLPSTGAAIELREEAGEMAKEMIKAAKEDNVDIYLSAGYRSYKNQEELYAARVSLLGEVRASKIVESAGCSEHQTGLSIDITDDAAGASLNESFAESQAYLWMEKNAYKYGYILRYPKGKEKITGLSYQPWHFRYIGKDYAKKLHKAGDSVTFEEFFDIYREE